MRASLWVLGPALGEVEPEVDGHVRTARGERERDADLTVGDLACRAGVLPLHAHRVLALLEEPGVVENPGLDGLRRRHRLERVASGGETNDVVVPVRVRDEVQQALMSGVDPGGASNGAGSDGLDALALTVAEQAMGVGGEGSATSRVAEEKAELLEVVFEARSTRVGEVGHTEVGSKSDGSCKSVRTTRKSRSGESRPTLYSASRRTRGINRTAIQRSSVS